MTGEGTSRESLPGWLTVSLVAGLGSGLVPVLIGFLLAVGGGAINGCDQFGDFGCEAYVFLGLFACPGSAAAGAIVAGLNTAWMSKSGTAYTRREAWKRSFALAFISMFVGGPISLSVLRSL